MPIQFNRFLLTQTAWDSSSLTPLAAVLHRFKETGRYQGIVYRGKTQVGLFDLIVDEKADNVQLDIDLEAVRKHSFASRSNATLFRANPHQPVLFHLQRGRGGYSVAIFKTTLRRRTTLFNSLKLRDGDLFTVTPNRSGSYAVLDGGKIIGEIAVQKRLPQAVPTEPLLIDLKGGAMKPAKARAQFMQPIFFHLRMPAHIRVELQDKVDVVKKRKKRAVKKKSAPPK